MYELGHALRVNLHRLIAAGIPELKFHALITHGTADFKWRVDNIPPEINLTHFGSDSEHPLLRTSPPPVREWKKGRRVVRHLRENRVAAVILNGYRFIPYAGYELLLSRGHPFFVNSDSNIRQEWPMGPLKAFAKRTVYHWWIKRAFRHNADG